jgi:hypothetical protein
MHKFASKVILRLSLCSIFVKDVDDMMPYRFLKYKMLGFDIIKVMSDIITPESGRPAEGSERSPWNSPETIAQEIREKKQPVDYKKLFQDKRVLFLADDHSNSSIRLHIAQHGKELRESGVTHYAIEAKARNWFILTHIALRKRKS